VTHCIMGSSTEHVGTPSHGSFPGGQARPLEYCIVRSPNGCASLSAMGVGVFLSGLRDLMQPCNFRGRMALAFGRRRDRGPLGPASLKGFLCLFPLHPSQARHRMAALQFSRYAGQEKIFMHMHSLNWLANPGSPRYPPWWSVFFVYSPLLSQKLGCAKMGYDPNDQSQMEEMKKKRCLWPTRVRFWPALVSALHCAVPSRAPRGARRLRLMVGFHVWLDLSPQCN